MIFFNKVLNSVQAMIVSNYLAAKYGIAIGNDQYAYESTHGNDLAGIGNQGGTNIHSSSTSAGILNISNASAMDSAEYVLFGHDDAGTSSWVSTEVPNGEVQRISQEWRLNETGNVGTMSFTLDTTLLSARNSGFNGFVLMIDQDGDFSDGAILYPLEYVSGSNFTADYVPISDGAYVSIGSARYLTNSTGNFTDPSIWHANAVPGAGDVAVVDGATVTLTANQTVGRVEITSGSTLDLDSYTLTIDDSTIINNGTFDAGTGTVNYSKSGNQDIASVTYNHLQLTGSGTKTLLDDVTINGNLTITGATLDVDLGNDYSITIGGNWVNTTGAFEERGGTVLFNGTSDQAITSNGQDFYNVNISNSATQVSLNDRMSVTNTLTLTDGVITTGSDTIAITNTAAASVTGYSSGSFINGNLQRAIATNTSTYAFPVGNGTETTNYYLSEIINNNLTTTSYIVGSFGPLSNHDDADLTATDTSQSYNTVNTAGIWTLEPDVQPDGGTYNIRVYITNMSGFEDNKFGVLKRPVGTDGTAWTAGGGHLNAEDGLGRLVAHGYMFRSGLSSFSEFGGGGGDGGGGGLPIKLISFTGMLKNKTVQLYWVTATEINNDFFTLEKSGDGITFEELAIIEGAGNSSETRHYSYIDPMPYDEITYYKLKQTDYDGTFEYSDIISVTTDNNIGSSMSLFPNPVQSNNLNIMLAGVEINSQAVMSITDNKGVTVYTENYDIAAGSTLLEIFLPENLSGGIYQVSFKTPSYSFKERLVILN